LQAWKRIPNAEIHALCDIDDSKLNTKAELYGVPQERRYSSLEEMLQQSDINILDIVTPPSTHVSVVETAAAAGKHILCQKPFALNLKDGERMVRTAEEAGVCLMVTENWRWMEPYQAIKKVLDEGRLGKIHNARYSHWNYASPLMGPERDIPQPFFREMPRLIFYEMGVHWVDVWRFLFGQPKRVYAEMKRISPHVIGEDCGAVLLGYDDFYGVLDMSWASRLGFIKKDGELKRSSAELLKVDGEKGTLVLEQNGKVAIRYDEEEEIILPFSTMSFEESHYLLQSHFVDALDQKRPIQTDGPDNLKTLEVVFAIYESAEKQQVVHL
jgi:predicted dehydrogenase